MTENEISHLAIDITYGHCIPTYHRKLKWPDEMSHITWQWLSPTFRFTHNGIEYIHSMLIEFVGQTGEELRSESLKMFEEFKESKMGTLIPDGGR